MNLKRTIKLLKEYLRMNNIIELTNVNKYRLDEINKIRDYFNNEIMSVKWVHLFLIIKKYQSGSQQAFLIVQIIIV